MPVEVYSEGSLAEVRLMEGLKRSKSKRLFDLLFSFIGILLLSPFFLLVSLFIVIGSGWPVFYMQSRVGRGNKDFRLIKFRSMHRDADKRGLLTVGGRDPRVTAIGYYLRKYKLDELPQLFNVLFGSMSLVGPRPEVRKYVSLYTEEQMQILRVKPGITDYASIEYFNENELLAKADDPEKIYIEQIMPAKIALNKKYIQEAGLITDLKIIFRTLRRVVR